MYVLDYLLYHLSTYGILFTPEQLPEKIPSKIDLQIRSVAPITEQTEKFTIDKDDEDDEDDEEDEVLIMFYN